MRPTNVRPSARRTPLTFVFGTAARVNVLRELCQRHEAVAVPALAASTGLNVRGLRRVLDELEAIGVIASSVGGGSRRVTLDDSWPLTAEVRGLFSVERVLAVSFDARLRATAQSLRPHPISMWITGAYAADRDEPGEPISVCVLADASDVAGLRRAFEHSWLAAQRETSLPLVDVIAVTTADLAVAQSLAEHERAPIWHGPHVVLAGLEPSALLSRAKAASSRGATATSHAERDSDALRRAAAISALVRHDSSLISRAHASLERRRATASPRLRAALDEWLLILSTSTPPAVRRLLVSNDERMMRLRQSMPFLDVLHPDERKRFDRLVDKAMRADSVKSSSDHNARAS
jgi:hypothetical protein